MFGDMFQVAVAFADQKGNMKENMYKDIYKLVNGS